MVGWPSGAAIVAFEVMPNRTNASERKVSYIGEGPPVGGRRLALNSLRHCRNSNHLSVSSFMRTFDKLYKQMFIADFDRRYLTSSNATARTGKNDSCQLICLHQQLILESVWPTTDRYIALCLPVIQESSPSRPTRIWAWTYNV